MIPRAHFSAPVLNEGTGRQVLQQLRGRFLRVNQGRLARAREGLAPRQQTLLSLLALLFHVNHPLLPGYVSDCTPAGVSGYTPDAATLPLPANWFRTFLAAWPAFARRNRSTGCF